MHHNIIFCLILLTLVALAHVIHIDYDRKLEHMVISDSDYSNCRVGCLIACSNREHVLSDVCYEYCVKQCWNY